MEDRCKGRGRSASYKEGVACIANTWDRSGVKKPSPVWVRIRLVASGKRRAGEEKRESRQGAEEKIARALGRCWEARVHPYPVLRAS